MAIYWDYLTLEDLTMDGTMVYFSVVSKDFNSSKIKPIRLCMDIKDISSIISNISSGFPENKIYPIYPVKESIIGNIILEVSGNAIHLIISGIGGVGIYNPQFTDVFILLKDKDNFVEAISTLIFVELMGKK